MKRTYLTLVVASLFAALNVVSAQEAASPEKSFEGMVVGTEQFSAKVKKVNHKTRKITLEGPQRKHVSFIAGPEVSNFDQIKKGDSVNITYSESVDVQISGAGAPPSRQETLDMERAPKGKKPGGAITESAEVYGVITDIDRENRTVTVKGPERTIKVKADEDEENFETAKVGDNVYARYTEKLAINVVPK